MNNYEDLEGFGYWPSKSGGLGVFRWLKGRWLIQFALTDWNLIFHKNSDLWFYMVGPLAVSRARIPLAPVIASELTQ